MSHYMSAIGKWHIMATSTSSHQRAASATHSNTGKTHSALGSDLGGFAGIDSIHNETGSSNSSQTFELISALLYICALICDDLNFFNISLRPLRPVLSKLHVVAIEEGMFRGTVRYIANFQAHGCPSDPACMQGPHDRLL